MPSISADRPDKSCNHRLFVNTVRRIDDLPRAFERNGEKEPKESVQSVCRNDDDYDIIKERL